MEDILFDLYYKQAHRNEELELTIDELLHKIKKQNQKIGDMQKEIDRLHQVFDIKDSERVELVKENIRLRHELNEVKNNANNKIY